MTGPFCLRPKTVGFMDTNHKEHRVQTVLGEVAGLIGGTIGIAQSVPQILRIRKLGHSNGLVLSPWILMYVQFSAWVGFGIKIGSPSIYATNFLTFIGAAMVVLTVKGYTAKNIIQVLVAASAACLFVMFGPGVIVDCTLIILTGSRLPQLIKTWWNRANATVTAVSISALVIALTSMSFWMLYGLLNQNGLVITTTIVAMTITLATALIESRIATKAKAQVVVA